MNGGGTPAEGGLRRQAGQPVVVLVDEYDKPILDALDAPEMARANRDYLGALYSQVRQSLNRSLLRHLVQDASAQAAHGVRLYRLLEANDFTGLRALFEAFFASIPYERYTNNDISRYEGYYASVFYSYFAALGLDVTVEDRSSHGRLDMAVRFNEAVYLFEFKVVETAGEGAAMAQLKAKGYADKYRAPGQPIHLVAVEFSRDDRNVTAFEVERA